MGPSYPPALIFVLAPGGFITLGLVLAAVNKLLSLRRKKSEGVA